MDIKKIIDYKLRYRIDKKYKYCNGVFDKEHDKTIIKSQINKREKEIIILKKVLEIIEEC